MFNLFGAGSIFWRSMHDNDVVDNLTGKPIRGLLHAQNTGVYPIKRYSLAHNETFILLQEGGLVCAPPSLKVCVPNVQTCLAVIIRLVDSNNTYYYHYDIDDEKRLENVFTKIKKDNHKIAGVTYIGGTVSLTGLIDGYMSQAYLAFVLKRACDRGGVQLEDKSEKEKRKDAIISPVEEGIVLWLIFFMRCAYGCVNKDIQSELPTLSLLACAGLFIAYTCIYIMPNRANQIVFSNKKVTVRSGPPLPELQNKIDLFKDKYNNLCLLFKYRSDMHDAITNMPLHLDASHNCPSPLLPTTGVHDIYIGISANPNKPRLKLS